MNLKLFTVELNIKTYRRDLAGVSALTIDVFANNIAEAEVLAMDILAFASDYEISSIIEN